MRTHHRFRIAITTAATGMLLISAAQAQIALTEVGSYSSGVFGESAAEIVAYHAETRRAFVVNAAASAIDVLDLNDPATPTLLFSIDVTRHGDSPNSVAVHGDLVAVAVQADPKTDPGAGVFFDVDGNFLAAFTAGALPDMITFSPNGRYVLIANEGEPDDDYVIDPRGSVTLIDLRRGLTNAIVTQIGFEGFDRLPWLLRLKGVRIFGPNALPSQDLEPEYITVTPDSRRAFVVMQENNAIVTIDLRRGRVTDIFGLGVRHHARSGNGIDASDRDDDINIRRWPVFGLPLPDSIATYRHRNRTYIVTANEGDSRDYDGFAEEARIGDLELDARIFPNAAELQMDENIGRLKVTNTLGDIAGNGDFEALSSFGTRSFSIYTDRGRLVYDSRDDFEQISAQALPDDFNSNNDENDSLDSRSDDKGPEPEALAIGSIEGRVYAFIGLERIGGIMVYDITNPNRVRFVEYVNNRDFQGDPESGTAGDLGPESILFVPADESPLNVPLMIVANEVSGTTTVWRIDPR
ncbi:MAG: choice-of-anchor I family protein [Phycisphaerales bacterium]